MLSTTQAMQETQVKPGQGLLHKYATAATVGSFSFLGLTGILMIFGLDGDFMEVFHEILGVTFILAALLHVMRNWRGFTKTLKFMRNEATRLKKASSL